MFEFCDIILYCSANLSKFLLTILRVKLGSKRLIKARKRMFVLYLRKVCLIKYIQYKSIQMECGEPFYKKVACLHALKRTFNLYFAAL